MDPMGYPWKEEMLHPLPGGRRGWKIHSAPPSVLQHLRAWIAPWKVGPIFFSNVYRSIEQCTLKWFCTSHTLSPQLFIICWTLKLPVKSIPFVTTTYHITKNPGMLIIPYHPSFSSSPHHPITPSPHHPITHHPSLISPGWTLSSCLPRT